MQAITDFNWLGLGLSVLGLLFAIAFVWGAITLRRVVPTNMVHIVQSTKKTTPYGRGKPAGNTYYEFPSWVPFLGVSVTEFPESNFQVRLDNYDAYDNNRLPFVVDIVAFFRVHDAEIAAQRVASFTELNSQIQAVVQGSVRRILATVLVQASAPVLVRALAPVLVQESVLVSALAESREPEARALFPQFEFLQEKQIAGFRSSALL